MQRDVVMYHHFY